MLYWSQILLLVIAVLLFIYGASSIMKSKPKVSSSISLNISDFVPYIIVMLSCGIFILFVLSFCSNIHPMEQFESSICDGQSTIEDKITCAEMLVRKLITRADAFTEGELGNEGQKNPRLVAEALGKSRSAASGPLIACSPGQSDETGDVENRLTRLETTLRSFTEPIFIKAASAGTCEGFATLPSNEERIATILSMIQSQQTKYLKPIDDKVAALQRHELSDCDKNKGAAVFQKTGK